MVNTSAYSVLFRHFYERNEISNIICSLRVNFNFLLQVVKCRCTFSNHGKPSPSSIQCMNMRCCRYPSQGTESPTNEITSKKTDTVSDSFMNFAEAKRRFPIYIWMKDLKLEWLDTTIEVEKDRTYLGTRFVLKKTQVETKYVCSHLLISKYTCMFV